MASIIPGYEYDIFISYRQKDNKGDRWVSAFVDALKTELESTFKEEISVFFDVNSHDGLLETHDVDASLKDKLKCVVFIPIVSRTYCDPKSFAWEHEFKSFVDKATKDQSGLKIKLPNGNVASRILPIKINDLDPEDKILLENEIGGVLRSIEFIYMSPGVNRPLRATEDHPQDNLNKTYYLDQINKVANAVKEIITAIKKHNQQNGEIIKEVFKSKPELPTNLKVKILLTSIIILALIVFGYFFIPRLSKPEKLLEKSIAVLPFRNDSPNDSTTYFLNGVMEEILNNLQKISDFSRVLTRNSVEQFRNNTSKSTPEIAKKLGVNYIVEGSGQKYGNKIVLRVQLIADNEKHLWGKSYEQEIHETTDIINIQSQIAQLIAAELKTTITSEEIQLIEKTPTTNLTAYDFYQRGRDEYSNYSFDNSKIISLKKAEDYYHQTLKYDSKFALAYMGLARVFWDKHSSSKEYFSESYMDSVLILSNIALSLDNKLAEAYTLRGDYYRYKGSIQKAIDEYDKALAINPHSSDAYMGMGLIYEYDDYVKSIYNYQKAAALNHGLELPELLRTIALQYNSAGFPEKGKYYYAEALNLDRDSAFYYDNLGVEYIPGNYEKAIAYLLKGYSVDSSNEDIAVDIMDTYMFQNKPGLSLKYFKNIDTLNFHRSFVFAQMHNIGWALWENGRRKEAEFYFNKQLEYSKGIIQQKRPWGQKLYPYFDMAEVYAFKGDKENAYKYLNLFNQRQTMPFWILTYLRDDPLFNSIRNESAFQIIAKDIEHKYQTEHERVQKWLAEQGML